MRTASELDFAASFPIILARCISTVLSLMSSSRAITLLELAGHQPGEHVPVAW
jgi:hypothetical protein